MSDYRPEECRASLIVLNYEGASVLDACVSSLLASAGEDDELIVVDNASTDGNWRAVQDLSRVRLLRLPQNTYIFGLNEGLAVARGRFVAFLNNDMTVEPDFVEQCLKAFGEGSDVFAVCPRILQLDGEDQGSRTAGYWHRGLVIYRSLPHRPEIGDCFFAVGGQSFFRRQMLEEIGSIDPLLRPMYHEDIELSYRAWKRGWRIVYAPAAVAHHLGGHTSRRVFTARQLGSFVRQNEFLTIWKDVTDLRLLATHFTLLPLRLILAVVRGDAATLTGFSVAARRLREVLRSRRRARRFFVLRDREVLARVKAIE